MAFTVIRGHTYHIKTQVKLGPSIKKLHKIQDQLLVSAKSHAPPPQSNFFVTCIIQYLLCMNGKLVHDKKLARVVSLMPSTRVFPGKNSLVNKSNFLGSFPKNGKKLQKRGTLHFPYNGNKIFYLFIGCKMSRGELGRCRLSDTVAKVSLP